MCIRDRRNIIGDLELDETLTSRETINAKMQESLDIATEPWGLKVTRVELKLSLIHISPPVPSGSPFWPHGQ